MFYRGKPSHYNNAFMLLVGLGSALLNTGAAWLLARINVFSIEPYGNILLLILGVLAFFVFYSFSLLISARTVWWMLGQAVFRWGRLLLVVMASGLFFVHNDMDIGMVRLMLIEWTILALALQLVWMLVMRKVIHQVNNSEVNRRKAVFIGMGREAQKLALRIQRSPILGIEIDGYYAEQEIDSSEGDFPASIRYLGTYRDACENIVASDYKTVFVSSERNVPYSAQVKELVLRFFDSTGSIYFLMEAPMTEDFSVHGTEIAGVPLLALHETQLLGLFRYLKRAMDLVIGGLALILLSPVMLMVAIAIKLDSPGPVLFRQQRYGERGLPITVFKFRSMWANTVKRDDGLLQQATAHDARVTKVGRILRKTSLDELPQLFNVMLGTMSLVGPRPHAVEHNEYYRRLIPGYMLRHSIKPGITGWAQVNGLRGETETPEKMQQRIKFDRYYIMNWSLWLDIKILFRTAVLVVMDKNAY
ncbi:undecaprenyl-phosphate glucose phosphotransferase [Kerstersia sp.]|uniref:undecaprenyl-phosphate glucose phosphotransferase n=1 Tax=Kerstersia sp. TaxID=1930783 RepID=UPI003F91CE0D